MKHFITVLFAVLLTLPAVAQNTFSIRGRVLDKVSGETLPGATVQVTGGSQNTGGGADSDGNYKIGNLPAGTYTLQASFIGYKPSMQTVKITTQSVLATFMLAADNASLDEVTVVAAQAQERSTPVAFSAVNEVKLRETLSNRDLPMILNETPGVYATQGVGGGTGDSRINVRGFDQRNVAVMINGVPVNDMENGQVYWSNWDLGDVTKSLQVQRGLSASKITVPSVGGTINVLTKGFDDKRSVLARVETGSNNYQKYSLMLSSGELKGGWAVTAYGARRTQDGWVDKTFDDAWTYFGTVSKRMGKHTFSLTGMGSPQSHGQRIPFGEQIGVYSNEKARELGAAPIPGGDKGFQYNKSWGYLDRYTLDGSGNRISHGQEVVNERVNYFHKPQINFNHFWNATDKLFISTVLYASKGTGGGSQPAGTSTSLPVDAVGQDNFQKVYDTNFGNLKADGQRQSTQYLSNLVNSHRWYGLVTGFDYLLKPTLTLSAGVDARYYYGMHYREIRDLLGGDYAVGAASTVNRNADAGAHLKVGDKFGYYNDSKTAWLGGYGQLEYKTPLLSAVVSGTISRISYARIDYFQPKQVTVDGKSYDVPYGAAPLVINGQSYTNADGHYLENDWVNIYGYSVKAGANYNLTEHENLFANVGYNSKVPFYQFVFTNSGQKFNDIRNEGITSLEVGYGINYPSMKVTLNAYYTYWANKSSNTISRTDGVNTYNNVRNVDARHMGIEMSVAQEISRRFQLNAAISLGDWRWAGNGLLNQTDDNNQPVGTPDTPIYLKGVHVGDAAQNQFQIGLRYEPAKGFYVRPSFLLFTKYYAGFDPLTFLSEASRTDTYRMPTSRNLDLHLGYDLPNRLFSDKVRLGIKGSILNVLNEFYISDVPTSTSASNPSSLQGFFNRGRTFTVGLSATL